ncbi:MAG: TIGR02270 family protein [Thiolinea sp.]
MICYKTEPATIRDIVAQHAEETAFLWLLRNNAVKEAHYNLMHLKRLEDRLEAHLDGLRVAQETGWECALANLEQFKESGEMFATATLAFENSNPDYLQTLYVIAEQTPEAVDGLISALGWVEPEYLQGKVNGLLSSKSPFWRRVGIAACAIHRVDPKQFLEQALQDEDSALRSRALKACGELGRSNLRNMITPNLAHKDLDVQFWAAWSLTLLGNRLEALEALKQFVFTPTNYAEEALRLLCRTQTLAATQQLLGTLFKQHQALRLAIQGAGASGDSRYIPWLIQQMAVPEQARVAGEAFSLITGVDLAYDDLEMDKPADFQAGPSEDADDDNVALDADENLPWPDPTLLQEWWQQHQTEFVSGQRYLMGQMITSEQCEHVLKTAMQRQRYAAALELALSSPAAALFETCAKVSRQKKLLNL